MERGRTEYNQNDGSLVRIEYGRFMRSYLASLHDGSKLQPIRLPEEGIVAYLGKTKVGYISLKDVPEHAQVSIGDLVERISDERLDIDEAMTEIEEMLEFLSVAEV